MNLWINEEEYLHTRDLRIYAGDEEKPRVLAEVDPDGELEEKVRAPLARKMAAAEELFDAIVKARAFLRDEGVLWEEALDSINVAIEKAEGRS